MTWWFNHLFGGGQHRAVRRDVQVYVTTDEDGNVWTVPTRGEAFLLSPEGSIDRVKLSQFYHCGHSTDVPAGGQCAEASCRRISCERCQCVCYSCQRPLCPEHANFVSDGSRRREAFCWRCYDDLQWQSTLGRFWHALIGRGRE